MKSPSKARANERPRPVNRSSSTVDPRWLLRSAVAVMAIGLLCAYLTLCGLFYLGQWQLVLHPSHTVAHTPAETGLAFQAVRFGDDLAGQPQLTGWWMPSEQAADPTVLLLHGEDGSMSEALPAALALHRAGLNVLLFDYRGYGGSAGGHPTQQRMREDADNALNYLTQTRKLHAGDIVVYGTHLGASLAVSLCQTHPQLAALILESADGDTTTRVLREARSHIVPLSLLFHQTFPLADALHTLKTPKLLISYTNGAPPEEIGRAADPKLTLELPPAADPAQLSAAVRRFLDSYVVHPIPLL